MKKSIKTWKERLADMGETPGSSAWNSSFLHAEIKDLRAYITELEARTTAAPTEAVQILAAVRAAVTEYYDAMVQRQHGGVAMSEAMNKIEGIFGLHYDTYRDSKK